MSLFDIFKKPEHRDVHLQTFKDMFVKVQEAVNNKDENILRDMCTDEMLLQLMVDKGDNNTNRARNIVKDVVVEHIYTIDDYHDENTNQDVQSVRIQATMLDYYQDAEGKIVQGSDVMPIFVEETWEFTRVKNSVWYLASISD